MLGLLGVSACVIATKPTVLGLDLQGGTELVYQGQPTPAGPGGHRARTSTARSRSSASGSTRSASPSPRSRGSARTRSRSACPTSSDAQRAIEQIGTTAQLYFYDFEPNVIPPNPDVAEPGGAALQPRLIDAVEAASKQPEVSEEQCQKQGCTTSGDTYYLFDKNTLEPIGEPPRQGRPLPEPPGRQRPARTRSVVAVPRGTMVVEDVPEDDPATADVDESDAPRQFFVLHDRPALSGDEITDPKQGTDQFNQPNVTFDFTDEGREAFQDVTRTIAQRGADDCAATGAPCAGSADQAEQFSGHFAIVLDNEVVSRPIINFAENPDGIDGRTGAQISGGFDDPGGPGPGRASCRSARCRST